MSEISAPNALVPGPRLSLPGQGEPTRFGAVRTIEPRFRRVLRRAEHYASSPLPLLLLGESSTGKEVLARAVHEASAARGGPFVAVNCGGIQASLLESELFRSEERRVGKE